MSGVIHRAIVIGDAEFDHKEYESIKKTFADNAVTTSKYNALTFIPRALFEQFRRVANVYFLAISMLMLAGTYSDFFASPLSPWGTLTPLVVVLILSELYHTQILIDN